VRFCRVAASFAGGDRVFVITGPPHFALASEASGQREYLKKMPRRTLATLGGAACGESR
jgi:hypothetical protein